VEGAGFSSSVLSRFCYDLNLPEQFGLSFERWMAAEILEEPLDVIAKVQMEFTSFERLMAKSGYRIEQNDGWIVNRIQKLAFRTKLPSNLGDEESPSIRILLNLARPEHSVGKTVTQLLSPDAILESTNVQAILSRHRFDALLQSCPASRIILSTCTPVTKEVYVAATALAFRNQFEECSLDAIPYFQEDLMNDLRKTIRISDRNAYRLVREFSKRRGISTNGVQACMSKIGLGEQPLTPEQLCSLLQIASLSPRSQCKAHICSLVWQSLIRLHSDALRPEKRHAGPAAK